MDSLRRMSLPPLLYLILFTAIPTASAAAKCYSMAGNLIQDPNVVPCNPLTAAGGPDAPHSSCCNQATGDFCTSTGLCVSGRGRTPSGILWTNGCTDPTWRDSSCPQYCNPPVNSTSDIPNPTLRACTSQSWCCAGYYKNDEECCKNNFTLARGFGKIERQLVKPDATDETSSTATLPNSPPGATESDQAGSGNGGNNQPAESGATQDGSSPDKTAAAITGGILGTLLLGVSSALAFFLIQNRRLKRELEDVKRPPALAQSPLERNTAQAAVGDYHKYYQHSQSPSPGNGLGLGGHGGHHGDSGQGAPPVPAAQEMADPHYGTSPPVWVRTELPTYETQRPQLES